MLTLLPVLITFTILAAIEAVAGPPGRRRSRRANLALVLPVIAAGAVTDVVVAAAAVFADNHHAGVLGWLGVDGAVAVVAGLVLLDLVAYTSHRVRHFVGPLWALHRAHHTDIEVDLSTSFRHHPLDVVVLNLSIAAGVALFGVGTTAVAITGALTAVFGLLAHTRVELPAKAERMIGKVLQTPGLHRMHHSPFRHETDSNFGLILTAWDRIFGTYTPANPARNVGLDTVDLDQRQSVAAMLAEPWRPLVKVAAVPVA